MIVTASAFDSLSAMNRIIAAVQAKSGTCKVRLAGCVANRSRETNEVDRSCDRVGFIRIAQMPDIDAIRRCRLKKKTLFEMDDSVDIIMARAEYMRRADTLWQSVQGEGSPPAPLPDREILELAGFD